MTHSPGKSDRPIVPEKSPNKAPKPGGGGDGGKGASQEELARARHEPDTVPEDIVTSGLERVRQAARRNRQERFTALMHHVCDVARLAETYRGTNRKAAPGIDGQTWAEYGEDLECNLQDLNRTLGRRTQGRSRMR